VIPEFRAVMHMLFDFNGNFRFLGLIQLALTVWMLVDAYRRRADYFWFFIILLLQPFGAWIYFFAVKLSDFRGVQAWPLFQRRVSTEELRYRAEKVPTLANHLALAQRLLEQHNPKQALPHLEAALAREPEHSQVLFGLAQCAYEQGDPHGAVSYLERLVGHDRRWSDYAAMRLLITARAESGDGKGALGTARELARLAPTLQNHCILAECLLAEGLNDEAWNSLQQSLQTHRFAPGPSRRRNRSWARQARRLQKQIAARSKGSPA
jgi:hypothetical protein